MKEEKYYNTIIAFQATLSEFRFARFPILNALGMTPPSMAILSALYRHGEVSRIELAELLGLGTNALGRPINRLVHLKLIKRTEDSNNRRYIKLCLTKTGHDIAKIYRTKMCEVWDTAFKNISDEKLKQFTNILSEMSEHLKKQRD